MTPSCANPLRQPTHSVESQVAPQGKYSPALYAFMPVVKSPEGFARGDPLRRVHECVFGVLALEREPVDPRL